MAPLLAVEEVLELTLLLWGVYPFFQAAGRRLMSLLGVVSVCLVLLPLPFGRVPLVLVLLSVFWIQFGEV